MRLNNNGANINGNYMAEKFIVISGDHHQDISQLITQMQAEMVVLKKQVDELEFLLSSSNLKFNL
ncbi:MAG: hypothetical protein H0V01_08425 [Bacteroidetes bacterium]|nr:hypothetical protein [Bacteroidota bacterium]HET6243733.1 hypothetical protein [Bacteroidia bacterium]